MNKLRKSARGEDCTFLLSVCTGDPEETVLCHAPHPDQGVAFTREVDEWAAYGCAACHDAIDGRTRWIEPVSKAEAWLTAIFRTHARMRERRLM